MDCTKLIVFANVEDLELIADAMWQVAEGGVEVFEGNPIETVRSTCGWDYIDEGSLFLQNEKPYCACVVKSSQVNNAINAILSIANGQYGLMIERNSIIQKEIPQIDWENAWKDNYQVVKSGRFSVVPIWLYNGKKNKRTILINPSTGFGTGQHESTSIALELLDKLTIKDKSVLDIGTGSGILGIASIMAGASFATMLDYDKEAILNAEENVRLNNIANKTSLAVIDVLNNDIEGKYSIVLANLTADILISIVDKIRDCSAKGSRIVVSGILASRWEDVSVVYRNNGFKVKKTFMKGEWMGAILYI